MSTPFEAAQLNLTLFDLRREPELRKARSWFITEFHPESVETYFAVLVSEKNAWIRMVVGYWDMAASMVVSGAIDQESFIAAHSEIIGAFAKMHPFLEPIRARLGPMVAKHIEQVVMAVPDIENEMARRRARLKAMYDARQAAAN